MTPRPGGKPIWTPALLLALSALIAAACASPGGAQEATVAATPPTANGLMIAEGACPFEGCSLGRLRARADVPLRAEPDLRLPVTGHVAPGEWVTAGASRSYMPLERGVVVEPLEGLAVGDVVYVLEYHGEGQASLWRRGEIVVWMDVGDRTEDPNVTSGIRWDTEPGQRPPLDPAQEAQIGWWVEILRANGQKGWVRDPRDFDCIGLIDQSEACAAANPP